MAGKSQKAGYKILRKINIINITNEKICYNCGSNKTTLRNGIYERWYKHQTVQDKIVCHSCYKKLFGYPRYSKTYNDKKNPITNKQRYLYKNRRILSDYNPRTGYCSQCSNNIYDGTCKKTQMHHSLGYYIIFPYFGLVELCSSCHVKTRYLDE